MKRFLLKITLIATAALACVGFIPTLTAFADEGMETPEISVEIADTDIVSTEEEMLQNDPTDEAEMDTWFDETIKPMIIQYGAGLGAFLTAAFIALKDTQKTKKMLFEAVAAVAQSNAENKDTATVVQELKEKYSEDMEKLKIEHAEEIKVMQDLFVQAVEAIRETVAVKVDDIDDVAHKILDVERLAYCNNTHLVSNGTAKRIAGVIDNVTKKKDENAK